MSHPICDACETVSWCYRKGCIPVQEDKPRPVRPESASVPAEIFDVVTSGWLKLDGRPSEINLKARMHPNGTR